MTKHGEITFDGEGADRAPQKLHAAERRSRLRLAPNEASVFVNRNGDGAILALTGQAPTLELRCIESMDPKSTTK
jgi:hypothetical protein